MILPIHEQGMSSHIFVFFMAYSHNAWYFIVEILASLFKFIPKDLIFCGYYKQCIFLQFSDSLTHTVFIYLRHVSSIPNLWSFFFLILKSVESYQTLCIFEMDGIILYFVGVIYDIYWYANAELSLHFWDRVHWTVM